MSRERIDEEERARFLATYRRQEGNARVELGFEEIISLDTA